MLAVLRRSQEITSTDRRGNLSTGKGKSLSSRELAQKIWGKRWQTDWKPTAAQRKAVARAMHTIAAKFPERYNLSGGKGRETLLIYEFFRIIHIPHEDWLLAQREVSQNPCGRQKIRGEKVTREL